jgi:DNA-binding CsgD family transcriptional regulator
MVDNHELSERELEILKLVATGASNKEIAQRLYISLNTVKVHLKKIFSKIGVVSRTEAAMYAVQAGLISSIPSISEITDQSNVVKEEINLESPDLGYKSLPRKPAAVVSFRVMIIFLIFISILISLWVVFYRNPNLNLNEPLPTSTALPRWQRKAEMPTARFGLAGAAFENQIYAIAGDTARGLTGVVEIYNPESDTWVEKASKPVPVSDIGAVVIGGRIYVPGGRLADGTMTDILEIYNPREDKWERGASIPVSLSAYAIAAYEGKLYLFGGWDGSSYLNRTFEYDPGLDRWSERSQLPGARSAAGAAVASEKIFIMGGYDGKTAMGSNLIYSPEMDTGKGSAWQKGSTLPEGSYAMGLAGIADKIYIVGGNRYIAVQNANTGSSYEYSPFENNFRLLENPELKSWTSLTLVPNRTFIYALGGKINNTPVAQNFSFQVVYTLALPVVR